MPWPCTTRQIPQPRWSLGFRYRHHRANISTYQNPFEIRSSGTVG